MNGGGGGAEAGGGGGDTRECLSIGMPTCVSLMCFSHNPGPHAAMLHTCDGGFQTSCDDKKSHAMCCDCKFNMLNILIPLLGYLSYLLCDLHAVCCIVKGI